MSKIKLTDRDFSKELRFQSSKSSGKGGQHVNKTESRISLFFHINNSDLLDDEEKSLLNSVLKNRLSRDGLLQIDVEKSRSQHQNKKIAIEQFYFLIEKGLEERRTRIVTKPSKATIRKRLQEKSLQSEKKKRRKDNLT